MVFFGWTMGCVKREKWHFLRRLCFLLILSLQNLKEINLIN